MSETPRVYSASGSRFQLVRRQRRRRLVRGALIAVLAALIYIVWISRDTHPVSEFVAANQHLQVTAPHLTFARHRVGASRVWEGVPDDLMPVALPHVLGDSHGLPEWMISNLAGGGVILTANDVSGWNDFVFISRMTRVGCVLERALRLAPSTGTDWAGGLRLRYWKPQALYYAVRGRTLLASPSRAAIIDALTLEEPERVKASTVEASLKRAGAEDFRGVWVLDEGTTLGHVVDRVRFAVRIEADEAYVKLQAAFRPEVAADLGAYWGNTSPQRLPQPFDGPMAVSANFGTDVEDTWAALSELFSVPWLTREQWEQWRGEDDGQSAAAVLTGLLGPMGPSVRVTWQSLDLNEMAPTPILVGGVSGDRAQAERFLAALDGGSADSSRLRAGVFYDAEAGEVTAPLMSGSSMTPVGRWSDEGLVFCTSNAEGARLLGAEDPATIQLDRPGNLYVRIRPLACTQLFVQAGRDLVQEGLIRGYTAQSYERASARWLETAGALELAEALATVNDQGVEADLYIKCSGSPVATPR